MTSTTRADRGRRGSLRALSLLMLAAAVQGPFAAEAGRVRVWLEGRGPAPTRRLEVRVEEVALLSEARRAVPLEPRPGSLSAAEIAGRQVALAAGSVPAGPYRGLRLTLRGVEPAPAAGGGARSQVPGVVVELREPFAVTAGETLTLVVSWNLRSALDTQGRPFAGAFSLAPGPRTVRRLVLYVSDPGGGRVVAVNRETLKVFAEVSTGRGTRGMDPAPDGRSLFVAVGGDDLILRLDTAAQRIEDRVAVKAGCRPVDVAVALGGERLAVSCAGSQVLAVLDARNNAYLGDVGLAWAPDWLAVSRDGRMAYALLPEGNQVVRLDVARVALAGAPAVVEAAPGDLAVDRVEGRVFVAHARAPVVSVLREDLTLERKLQVQWPARAVAVEEDGRRLYLAGGQAGGVSLVAVALGSLVREWVCPPAYRLALDPDGRKLYAAGGPSGRLLVLDRIAGRLLQEVEIGRNAADVVVVP